MVRAVSFDRNPPIGGATSALPQAMQSGSPASRLSSCVPTLTAPASNQPRTGVVIPTQSFRNAVVFRQDQGPVILRRPNATLKRGVLRTGEGEEVTVVHLPSGRMSRELVKTSEFAEPYIGQIGAEPRERDDDGINVNYVTSVWYAASDASALARNHQFFKLDNADTGLLHGLGYTSIGGLITGPLVAYGGSKALDKANAINDVGGQQMAKVRIARGVVETTSGAVMAGVRTIGLAGIGTTSKAIMTASFTLGIVSTVTSSLLYSFLIAQFSMGGIKSYRFMDALDGYLDQGDVNGAYAFLKAQLELSDADWTAAVNTANGSAGPVELTKDEVAILTNADFDRIRGSVAEDKQGLLAKEVARMKMVKEAKYLRRAGNESLTMLKKNNLDIAKVVATARDEARFNSVLMAFLVVSCVIGITSFILATVFTGGTFLIVGFALMLVMNIMMTVADSLSLFQAVESLKKASWKDKAVLVGFIVITMLAMAAGTYFSAGLAPMIVTLAVGAVMLGVQAGGMAWAYNKHHNPVEGETQI